MNTKEKNRTSSQDLQKKNNKGKNNQNQQTQKKPSINRTREEENVNKDENDIGRYASYEQSDEEPETPTKGLDVGDDPNEIKRKSPKMD
jgi:hypothetical protein